MLEWRESGHDTHPLTDQMTVGRKSWAVTETSYAGKIHWPTITEPSIDNTQTNIHAPYDNAVFQVNVGQSAESVHSILTGQNFSYPEIMLEFELAVPSKKNR